MALRRLIMLLGIALAPTVSMAQLSANFGMVSDYIYRGIYQEDASASAGLDYEHDSGFYIGTWGADVGDGLEYDIYGGYGGDIGDSGWGWSAGFTGYYYTDDFDDTYQEINLGLGWEGFSLDLAIGEWDGFGFSQDYTFTSISYEFDGGVYVLYGDFGDDFTGEYMEAGYGFDFMGLDLSIALIYSDDLVVSGDNPLADYNLVFGISRTFAIGGE